MYRSSPFRSTLTRNVSTYHSKNCFVLSKNEHFSSPAGSARFVHATKTAGLREFTMCQNIENHTDICKPWANYLSTGGRYLFHQQYQGCQNCKTARRQQSFFLLLCFSTHLWSFLDLNKHPFFNTSPVSSIHVFR